MAHHTNWDKWICENVRYALEYNTAGKRSGFTYSEYRIEDYENNEVGYIDVVGKASNTTELCEDIVVEIKGTLSDLNSGHGQNFVGAYNFFATDRDFLPYLLEYHLAHYTNSEVGVIVVNEDGTVETVIPAKGKNETLFIQSNFDNFKTDDDVEKYFSMVEIPKQMRWDSQKPYYKCYQLQR